MVIPPRWRPSGRAKLAATALALAALTGGTLVGDSRQVAGASLTADEILVACATNPVVVDITTRLAYPPFGHLTATGVVIDAAGDVLTNNHVVANSASIRLRNPSDGRAYDGTVVATDLADDLALVRMAGATNLSGVQIGDSTHLAAGQTVYAVGNGEGSCGLPRVTRGTITALGRSTSISNEVNGDSLVLTGLILSKVDVEPGYSGGALVNDRGELIGILTAGHVAVSCNCFSSAFAIPIDKALPIVAQMRAGVASAAVHVGAAASLGVAAAASLAAAVAPYLTGALITYLVPGSPADRLGLELGNQIVRIDDCRVHSALDLVRELQNHRPGDTVRIRWTDGYWHEHAATTVLAAGPPQ